MTKKIWSKKQIILVTLAAVILAAVIATAIAVPIVVLRESAKTVPSPYIEEFDKTSDLSVVIAWDKIKNALSYDVEYCFDNPLVGTKILSANTTNTKFTLQRKRGVLVYRVRASFDSRYGEYSDWQYFDIPALVLSTPTVSISDTLLVTWNAVRYGYEDSRKSVLSYYVQIYMDGEMKTTGIYRNSTNCDISNYILHSVGSGAWEDVVVKVRVRALNYYRVLLPEAIVTEGEYALLYGAYVESEYAEKEIIVTEAMYDAIVARYQP